MGGDTKKRIDWDGPASAVIPDASEGLTLRGWAFRQVHSEGESMTEIAKRIGCSWSTLQNALKRIGGVVPATDREAPASVEEPDTEPGAEVAARCNGGAASAEPRFPRHRGEFMLTLDCAIDLVCFCGGEIEAEEAWAFVQGWLARHGLEDEER